ncbi:MAG TPA: metal ABC transporter substrate-binding protein [Patescibacteria group bacterium]|nr:metal ABC transporter substrate-binding protein [Patescibacteria group bacterium]
MSQPKPTPDRCSSRLRIGLFLLVPVLLLVGMFVFWKKPLKTDSGKPTVATTIFPLKDLVQNVVGNEINVVLILPPGADAHTFDPPPSLLRSLEGATVIYRIGHGIDRWADTLASAVDVSPLTVDKNIVIRASAEHEEETEETEEEEEHGPTDPHYWLTVPNAKKIATTVTEDLSKRFPDRAVIFQTNLERYLIQLDQTDEQIRTILSSVSNRHLVTFHDAWYYFADAYGLTIAGTFEPTAGREPTPHYLGTLIETVQKAGVRTVYYEPQMDVTGFEGFSRDQKLNLVILDDIGGVPGRNSYIELMLSNAKTISQNP